VIQFFEGPAIFQASVIRRKLASEDAGQPVGKRPEGADESAIHRASLIDRNEIGIDVQWYII